MKTEEEYNYFSGNIDIEDDKIAQKFTDVFLIHRVEANPDLGENIIKAVDVSKYAKNHIIGITNFVQPQFFQEVKEIVTSDKMRERLRRELLRECPEAQDDTDFVDEIIDEAIAQVLNEENSTLGTQPIIPHCTVIQLKDGRWMWRPEQ